MSCEENPQPKTAYTNEDRDIPFVLQYSDGRRFNLTGASAIVFSIKKADGTLLQKTLAASQIIVISAIDGRGSIALLAADFAALQKDKLLSASILATVAGKSRNFKLTNFLKVEDPNA